MKVLFSIPVHESESCVIDMCMNIIHFVPGSIIILHCQNGFEVSIPSDLSGVVYLNPTGYETGFMDGSLSVVHLSNLYYSLEIKLEFDYFCPFGSNQMFVRTGFSNYISKYSCSATDNMSDNDSQTVIFSKDRALNRVLAGKTILKSAPEGTFYHKDNVLNALRDPLLINWFSFIEKHYHSKFSLITRKFYRQLVRMMRLLKISFLIPPFIARFGYASEEILLPTLLSSKKLGKKTCYIPWGRDSLSVKIDDVLSVHNSNENYFSVKRVDRFYDDEVRTYIREITGHKYEA